MFDDKQLMQLDNLFYILALSSAISFPHNTSSSCSNSALPCHSPSYKVFQEDKEMQKKLISEEEKQKEKRWHKGVISSMQ